MELDAGLVSYMRKRAEFAKLFACVIAVQCFVIAVFFCAYGIYISQFASTPRLVIAKNIIMGIAILISCVICVFGILVSIKFKANIEDVPDRIAIRQGEETVREAYRLARPILIYKITCAIALALVSGILYIMIMIVLDRSFMADIYAKTAVWIILAFVLMMAVPAIDRIEAYRTVLNENHSLYADRQNTFCALIAVSVGMPFSVCIWYIWRYYLDNTGIAWIIFPVTALFALSMVYLANYVAYLRRK